MRSLPLLLVSFCCYAQDPLSLVRDWLNFVPGNRWTYEYEARDGDRQHPDIVRWQEQVTVVAVDTIPEGTLVHRTVVLQGPPPPRWIHVPYESNILIHDDCLYYLRSGQYGWDDAKQQLTDNFRKDLVDGFALPSVCLPLAAGKTWGNHSIPPHLRDQWTVAGMGPKNPDDPASVTADSWRLEAHLASGMDNYIWFQKDVGIVGERSVHNGTYSEESGRLLRFDGVPR